MIKFPDRTFDTHNHVNSLCALERMQKAADLARTNQSLMMEDSKLAALNESAIVNQNTTHLTVN